MNKRAHDTYEDFTAVEGSSDRAFGLTVGAILLAIALVRWWFFSAGPISTWAVAVPGSVLVVLGLLIPTILRPLNKLWTGLGLLLAKIVNPIIMALMYGALFVPLGLAMKLFGRDALRQKPDHDASSFWIARDPPGPLPETMRNQF